MAKLSLLLTQSLSLLVASWVHASNNNNNNNNQYDTAPYPFRIPGSLRTLQEPNNNDSTINTNSTNNCTIDCCTQFMTNPEDCDNETSSSPFSGLPDFVSILLMAVLICLSALFSGLTLGLMGLDKTGLEIVMDSDDPVNAAYARKIYPLRKNGNLLLCTLLLGNTSVNALLSIIMADFTGGIAGFISSTFLILIFGEIIPQALCSRYALQIGSRAVPLVRLILILLYPLTKPLAWTLDKALGKELATTYSNTEMLKLLQIHVDENIIDPETANTMTGALQYKDIKVANAMTPLSNTFMLKTDEKLDFETIAKIFKTGYSRIPVYEATKNNVIGLLFVKDLIFIDPDDETRVRDFVEIFGRGVHVVWPDDTLGEVLKELKRGRSHMALVRDVNNVDPSQDPFYEITGIITLEDIIEEILGDEIVDETDAFLDGTHSVKLDRADAMKFARLRLLDSKIVDERLSADETRAVTAHLMKNHAHVVSLLTEHQLNRLISETPVSIYSTATQDVGKDLPNDLLYEKGVQTDCCTLILSGKVSVLVGADQFRSDVSSWALLGSGSLDNPDFSPDFTAFVSAGPCRCIRVSRSRYKTAVDASASEIAPSSHGSVHSLSEKEDALNMSLDQSEASRKEKLITALYAVEKSSKDKAGSSSKHVGKESSVMFAEPGELTESSRRYASSQAPAVSGRSSQSLERDSSNNNSGRFEYIASPAKKLTGDNEEE